MASRARRVMGATPAGIIAMLMTGIGWAATTGIAMSLKIRIGTRLTRRKK
jgi:hypothetical protein